MYLNYRHKCLIDLIFGHTKIMTDSSFPHFACGTVVHGFNRGSKELGCPTANFDENTVDQLPPSIFQGVYYGWARLPNNKHNDVYKMVTSVGTNPHYNGEKKTMETHILHEFPEDFYGDTLSIVLLGEIRKMTKFNSLDELITAIKSDITFATNILDSAGCRDYACDKFFH